MLKWNNCEEMEVGSIAHCSMENHIGHEPIHKVWYQEETDRVFGLDLTWKNIGPRESLLTNSHQRFFSEPLSVIPIGYIEDELGIKYEETKKGELLTSSFLNRESFVGCKILIIGAGPTTSLADWNPANYDHIFSCNHFFLNEKVFNSRPSLVTLCEEVNLENPKLLEFIEKNPDCAFGFDQLNSKEKVSKVKSFFEDNNSFCSWPRCQGKLGSITRLMPLAIGLGATEIHTVGFDGHRKGVKANTTGDGHSFEKGKLHQGTHDYNLFLRHFTMFWDYVLSSGRDIKFQNLGEGYPMNMSTDISRQEFPLEKNQ